MGSLQLILNNDYNRMCLPNCDKMGLKVHETVFFHLNNVVYI